MSPLLWSSPHPTIEWAQDIVFPGLPNPPTQNAVGALGAMFYGRLGYLGAQGSMAVGTVEPIIIQRTVSSAGAGTESATIGGMWCRRSVSVTGLTDAEMHSYPHYVPALEQATAPVRENSVNRILWLRAWLFSGGGVAPAPNADVCGLSLIPDDGVVTASSGPPRLAGGFGIYKRVGSNDFRYASYSPAAALLEAINLPAYAGWHTFDFIVRQARRGDGSTPWLTVRHDGVDIVTERPFGSALLAAPAAIRANANGLSVLVGCVGASGGGWNLSFRTRLRQGIYHPDGYPQPA